MLCAFDPEDYLMPDSLPLLTVVFEEPGPLDRESATFRRLLAARLRYESQLRIVHVEETLTTKAITALCDSLESKYVVFMRATQQLSPSYLATMLEYLGPRNIYLAEPVVYAGVIPKIVSATKIEDAYRYARDTDIYGVVFNTGRLALALEAIGDVDRSALYLSYRLYWSIGAVKPLSIGFSVATDTKAAIGLSVESDVDRLVPLIATASKELRIYLVRYLALFLRGLRAEKATQVGLNHLRDVVRSFKLVELARLVEPLQPFEAAWIRWLGGSGPDPSPFKQLSGGDSYLLFSEGEQESGDDLFLYRLRCGGDVLTIRKSYRPHDNRPGFGRACTYDFYSRPIGPHSTMLFFDRPMQADDNAEHLYEYFTRKHPEYTEAYFALNPKSPDWPRLKDKGFKLLPIFTTDFYEKFLISDLVVSSQIYNVRYRGKSFANSRFVYLQHGIQLNDMTDWVLSKYYDVFVATGELEADYMAALAPNETLNSGLPRYEVLVREKSSPTHLLFMPTWRFNLHQVSAEGFAKSDYCRAINELITDPLLLNHLRETGRILQVKLHPNVDKRAGHFKFSEHVIQSEISYREAITSAEMVFTDFSSAVLDAAFIETPIAYYHWDAADFFQEQPYEARVDYSDDGLGPVFHKHADVVSHIVQEDYLRSNEQFAKRRERFFRGVDPANINASIVERMLSL
jgi:CDP-glycerol glycerophosphotransferase (TagB/SpsB family)